MRPRIYRKWRRCVLVAVLLYLGGSILALSRLPEGLVTSWEGPGLDLLEILSDPFGSRTWNPCEETDPGLVSRGEQLQDTTNICTDRSNTYNKDIMTEDILDSMSVGYPNLVLTVTGWVDTIKVESYTAKPLQVIVVPHSHQDPGWLSTVDDYFKTKTRGTLNQIVDQLTANPSWTFIWAETIFLQMWWDTASMDMKEKMKRLVHRGQLEVVNGGLVMPDETVTHYDAILGQLREGHDWLRETLNVTIKNGWAIDPFGHSSTMAYISHLTGIRNIVIQRAHFAIKRHLAGRKSLEFYWQQHWDTGNGSGVFTHMMPFLLYSIPHSCGPDRHVCCKFDFHQKQCFYGKKKMDKLVITDENVANVAAELWEQLQKKSELFRSHVVLLPHGDDFRYHDTEEWQTQFGNLQKLMDYINNNPQMNMKMRFGTLKDYFDAVHSEADVTFPTLGGDLLPYSDRGDQYWSGFYTTRPFLKSLVRKLQSVLRSAEILMSMAASVLKINTSMTSLHDTLMTSRRTLALLQHHDAITGTSKKRVVNDYSIRAQNAVHKTYQVQKSLTQLLMGKGRTKHANLSDVIPENIVIKENELPAVLHVWNSLGVRRRDVASVTLETTNIHVLNSTSGAVKYQINPVWLENGSIDTKHVRVIFEIDVAPLSFSSYAIDVAKYEVRQNTARVSFSSNTAQSEANGAGPFIFEPMMSETIKLHNGVITARFSRCDGLLKSISNHVNGDRYKSSLNLVTYSTGRNTHPFRDKSGAYIFLPDGVAKYLVDRMEMYVIEGPLMSQVRTLYQDISHTATIYNLSSPHAPLNKGILLENDVNLASSRWDNMELAMRLETSVVSNKHHFCTDSNGFQLHRRKTRSKLTLQGNFYPMTTAAVIQKDHQRVSLLSSQSQGVASLVSGWLEVILDRRLVQDDWRGLNEGVDDNVPTRSIFFLMFEKLEMPPRVRQQHDYMCFHSASTNHLSQLLNNPVSVITYYQAPPETSSLAHTSTRLFPYRQNFNLPCGLHIVSMKLIKTSLSPSGHQVFLTLHRIGIDCHVMDDVKFCPFQSLLRFSDLPLNIQTVLEIEGSSSDSYKRLHVDDVIKVRPMTIKTFRLTLK